MGCELTLLCQVQLNHIQSVALSDSLDTAAMKSAHLKGMRTALKPSSCWR